MPYFAGQKLRASELNDLTDKDSPLPLGVLMWGNRTSNSTTTTTEVGVLRLDDQPVYLGRWYTIGCGNLVLGSSVANDDVAARIRITTDGSTPSTSSTQIAGIQQRILNTTNLPELPQTTVYVPTADEILSVLLTVARVAGTGNASIISNSSHPINLFIIDMGPAPGDSGTDI